MTELEKELQSQWKMISLFHKSNVNKVKQQTGAFHVIHIKDFCDSNKDRLNCLLIKGKKGEAKYGGQKNFNSWTNQDYQNAIKSYNNEFKQG